MPERVPEETPRVPNVGTPFDTEGPGAEGSVDLMLASRGLSAREIEVARLLALGHTNAEIAATLYLSVRTIEHHRASVFRKLRIHSRAALVSEMQRPAPETG